MNEVKNTHNSKLGSKIKRSDARIKETQEVFTPMELCTKMVRKIPMDELQDPNSTFLDSSAGNGNFIIALRDELVKYHPLSHVINNMMYAVELMEDNHKEMCDRLGISIDHPHYVCADSLEYNYSFGEPVGVEIGFVDN